MDIDEVKKVLASLCLTTLVTGASLALVASCGSSS